jgi:hypothetical protein
VFSDENSRFSYPGTPATRIDAGWRFAHREAVMTASDQPSKRPGRKPTPPVAQALRRNETGRVEAAIDASLVDAQKTITAIIRNASGTGPMLRQGFRRVRKALSVSTPRHEPVPVETAGGVPLPGR